MRRRTAALALALVAGCQPVPSSDRGMMERALTRLRVAPAAPADLERRTPIGDPYSWSFYRAEVGEDGAVHHRFLHESPARELALARAYLRAGMPREALAHYRTLRTVLADSAEAAAADDEWDDAWAASVGARFSDADPLVVDAGQRQWVGLRAWTPSALELAVARGDDAGALAAIADPYLRVGQPEGTLTSREPWRQSPDIPADVRWVRFDEGGPLAMEARSKRHLLREIARRAGPRLRVALEDAWTYLGRPPRQRRLDRATARRLAAGPPDHPLALDARWLLASSARPRLTLELPRTTDGALAVVVTSRGVPQLDVRIERVEGAPPATGMALRRWFADREAERGPVVARSTVRLHGGREHRSLTLPGPGIWRLRVTSAAGEATVVVGAHEPMRPRIFRYPDAMGILLASGWRVGGESAVLGRSDDQGLASVPYSWTRHRLWLTHTAPPRVVCWHDVRGPANWSRLDGTGRLSLHADRTVVHAGGLVFARALVLDQSADGRLSPAQGRVVKAALRRGKTTLGSVECPVDDRGWAEVRLAVPVDTEPGRLTLTVGDRHDRTWPAKVRLTVARDGAPAPAGRSVSVPARAWRSTDRGRLRARAFGRAAVLIEGPEDGPVEVLVGSRRLRAHRAVRLVGGRAFVALPLSSPRDLEVRARSGGQQATCRLPCGRRLPLTLSLEGSVLRIRTAPGASLSVHAAAPGPRADRGHDPRSLVDVRLESRPPGTPVAPVLDPPTVVRVLEVPLPPGPSVEAIVARLTHGPPTARKGGRIRVSSR